MSRWKKHDRLLREIDRRNAAEVTPLRLVPILAGLAVALLVWGWMRQAVEKPVLWIGSADAPRKSA